MESTSDFLLVHRARAGDEEACERLVRKYYPSIYQYCLLHIYDTYEAEDLTQEVFVRAFASLERYREYGKVKNYLYTIAGNVVKNYYKKKRIFCQMNCRKWKLKTVRRRLISGWISNRRCGSCRRSYGKLRFCRSFRS